MYNFKRNSKLYLVYEGLKYRLEVYPDLSVSQTFSEQGVPRKTLHTQTDLHEHAVITRANVASFSFTVPFFDQSTIQKELELSTSYTNGVTPYFDLYIESDNIIYKLEKAVFETTTFNLSRDAPITVSLSGSGSKISKVTTIPGTLQTTPTREYTRVSTLGTIIDSTTLTSVININIEVVNKISWTKNDTINQTLNGNIIYPTSFVLSGREVRGSVAHFVTDDNKEELSDLSTEGELELLINSTLLSFVLPSVVFTRRDDLNDLISRTYDFRLNTNSQEVKPIYKGV
jgi:hypothetical protein